MTTLWADEDDDDLFPREEDEWDDEIVDNETDENLDAPITLDDVLNIEEEESVGHKVQTYNLTDDGTDNYFDERYFDE
jgi:hypothetical protein